VRGPLEEQCETSTPPLCQSSGVLHEARKFPPALTVARKEVKRVTQEMKCMFLNLVEPMVVGSEVNTCAVVGDAYIVSQKRGTLILAGIVPTKRRKRWP